MVYYMYDTIIIILIILIVIASLYYFSISNNESNKSTENSEINILKSELNDLKTQINNENETPEININKINTNNINNSLPIIDPIANYDALKLSDPFIDPSPRTSIDQIPGRYFAPYINFPTRGIIDKYHRVGLLTSIDRIDRIDKEIYYDNNNIDNINNLNDVNDIIINDDVRRRIRNNIQSTPTHDIAVKKIIDKNKITVKVPYNVEPFGTHNSSYGNNVLELMGMKLYQNSYKYFTSFSEGNKIIKIMVNTKNNKELYDGDTIYIPELKQNYRVTIDQIDNVMYNPYFF